MECFGDARDWFFEKRFGLFLHFGLSAIEGWHEQDQMRRRIPAAEYQELIRRFNPEAFDPDAILDLAAAAGMEYVCLTTKHHDGFCLWNTALTDYNVMHSPYGRDLLADFAAACHRRGVPLGLYYSIADWHHPNYPNEGRHHELPGPKPGDRPDFGAYLEFLRAQVRELCTNYGPVSHFFWDMNVPKHQDPSINAMIRQLQPAAVINNRGFDDGDFGTPERDYQRDAVAAARAFSRPTEACNSVGMQSWGYRRHEDYYSLRYLIGAFDGTLAKGGNYLLNVGPDGCGAIPKPAASLLRRIGCWYHQVREAFDAAEPASELTDNRRVLLTRRGNSVYVHLVSPPDSDAVVLAPLAEEPERAVLLNSGAPVRAEVCLLPVHWQAQTPYLCLRGLPVNDLATEVPVVRLDFTHPPRRREDTSAREFEG